MLNKSFLILLASIMMTSGCMVKYLVKGDYYISQKKYKNGIHAFKQELAKTPDSPEVHYYLSRFYLADNQFKQGLVHIKNAV